MKKSKLETSSRKLKRRTSFTYEGELPKGIPRSDYDRLPAIPRFVRAISSLNIVEGASACFHCKIAGNPPPSVYWYKQGEPISKPTDRIWTETDRDGAHSLVVNGATLGDSGAYRCTIVNRLGRKSCVGLLTVHAIAPASTQRTEITRNIVKSNHQHQERVPDVYPFDISTMPPDKEDIIGKALRSSSDTSSLHDTSSSRKHSLVSSSSTSCPPTTDSEGYSSSIADLLDVEHDVASGHKAQSPQFINKPRSCVAEENGSAIFDCCVSGNPPPIFTWYKGAVELHSSGRMSVATTSGKSVLKVRKLCNTDAGTYRCVATNSGGKASCSVELRLTGSSQMLEDRPPTFVQPLTSCEVGPGKKAIFECKVEGKPHPTTTWTKDGKIVTASSRVRIMEVYGTHSLVISRVENTDSGVYALNASNYVGSESRSGQLHVQDMSSRGYSGSSHSSPNASTLSSPSLSPKMGRAVSSRPVSGNSSPWGSGSKSTPGRGGAPPRRRGPGFILRPKSQTVAAGEYLCLKCTLLGHPKPTVTWEKGGELVDEDKTDGHIRTKIEGNDYFLEIDQCGPEDAGKYAVTARNSLGKQTAAIEVTVTGTGGHVSRTPSKTISSHLNTNGNNNISRLDDNVINNKTSSATSSVTSDDERKTPSEFTPSSNLKTDSKDSPTSSLSSYSRTSSSRSNTSRDRHEGDTDDHRPSGRSGRRRPNVVAPTFLRRLSSTQVLEGEELLLQCEVSGDPDPKLAWLRNGLEVGIDEDEVFTSFRNGVARLRLRDVHPQHAGEYICKARNDGGVVQCSSRVTVKAKRIEVRPRFIRAPADIRGSEGETLTLEAEVEGVPTPEIVWSLDGEEITRGDISFHNNLARLVLHKVTASSSGQYMCNALNCVGEDSAACRVRVKEKRREITPEFTAPLSDITSAEGDDVCLRCMVTGIPEPSVEWMFNGEVMVPEEGLEISYHDGVAALTLEQATSDDTGEYTCLAVNSEGRATTKCQVTVKATKADKKSTPPSAPKFTSTFDEYIRIQEGDELTLDCQVTGYPEPEVTWTVNDKKVENGKATFQDGKAQIFIQPVTSNHGGHIRCSLSNYAGKATHEARVYVRSKRVAPSFETLLPSSLEIMDEKEAFFQCKVAGHPQPRVSWTRDGRSLSVLSTETSYEDGVAAVRIRKAGPREAGKYVCVARNLSGEAESVCIVTYLSKEDTTEKSTNRAPTFSKKLQDVTLRDGQDLHLECHVSGVPVPEVTWEVDGQKMESEDGDARFKDGVATMVLEDAMPEDSGRYRCVAANCAGKADTSCQVNVNAAEKIEPLTMKKEPSFPVLLEDKTVKEGQDIVLRCQVTGNPRPKITWLLDGEEIADAEIKYLDDGNAELLLTEALPEDEGVYTCIAENIHKRVMCSCRVTIDAPPKVPKKKSSSLQRKQEQSKASSDVVHSPSVSPPKFIEELKDCLVQDGSTEFSLSCRVSGNPTARWFLEQNEIEASDDFELETEGDVRRLVFTEVFPEDGGTYSCVVNNGGGEAKSSCVLSVEEIEGDAPTFLMKPKPVNINAGGRAVFSCRVDGDPPPTVQWMFCNQPIQDTTRVHITEADASNNYTYSLEIPQVAPQDAGRYSVCCRNVLGDVTCTVSLIVSDAKKQEGKKDFRDVLRKNSPVTKANSNKSEESVDFRSVLRSTSTEKDLGRKALSSSGSEDASEEPGIAYKDVLSTSVKTKALTEEERKLKRAEQKDFRSNLVRKVDTKVVTQDTLRAKGTEQLDFREEALKTKVKTKALGQDDLKTMRAEQKDFRSETIKSKVVTKAYREDDIKLKRAEQVDFRNLLSPKKEGDQELSREEEEGVTFANIPKAKWKKESDHTTVATKRSRHRGPSSIVPERKVQHNGSEEADEEVPSWSKPEFSQPLKDMEVDDGEPFTLVCHVTGDPRPEVTWYLEEEEITAETEIVISYEDDVCRLSIAESFPDDQGKYTCTATNQHGATSCSCYVTVIGDEAAAEMSNKPNYAKKQDSKTAPSVCPASIVSGPKNLVVVKGNSISLSCTIGGTPPLKVVWRKGRDEVNHNQRCQIMTSSNTSTLTIPKSERDDSGCYTLQVSNTAGVDQLSTSVSVVGVPEPPGQSLGEVRGQGLVVSWRGSNYDGGSVVEDYLLEMTQLSDPSTRGRTRWSKVASTKNTSHTIHSLKQNASYKFRASARNKHGLSKPGRQSAPVRYLVVIENGNDSTDDEDDADFYKYEPVSIKNVKFSSKYETKEKLGQGRFGKVHRVIHRQTGKQYAAKIMRALKAKDREAVAMEIEIMNQLRHPKLVQLIDAYQHEREVTMVMDLVAGGELFERVIDEDFEFTEAACIKYMRQICAGVKYMHDCSIVHLDLKPENIMCINRTGTKIKLIDFGLARKFNPNEPIRVMFGTPEFVAPEVINYDVIGFQTDMWSVGVICYILLSGLSPFSGDVDSETLSNITAVQWDFEDEAFDQISDDAKDFISKLLVKSLKVRFTVDKAMEHRWLKKDTDKMPTSKLNTKNLKRFLTRRKWQKTAHAVRALGRLASLAGLAPAASGNNGQQRESGFLLSLRAQLDREREHPPLKI